MKKLLTIAASLAILFGGLVGVDRIALATNCGQTFPTSLNGYVSGCTIPSSWGNALESKLGVTGSAVTSSLDYQINHIFTSYGSEVIATSALPGVVLFNTSLSGSAPITYNSSTGVIGWTNSNNYIPLTALSASGPIVYNSTTGAFSWTNSNNYIALTNLSATTPIVYNSSTGAFTFANSGVTSGAYNWANLTVASSGVVTSASSNSTPVTSISGTANQVTCSPSTGAATCSLPSAVTFPGTINTTAGTSTMGPVTATGITNSSVTSSLVLNNGSGLEGAFGGAASCTGSQVIQSLSASGVASCLTVATSSVVTPGGASTQIQYNLGGQFAATSTIYEGLPTTTLVLGNNQGNYQSVYTTHTYSTTTTSTITYTGATTTYTSLNLSTGSSTAFNISHTMVIAARGQPGANNSGTGGSSGAATGTLSSAPLGQIFTLSVGVSGGGTTPQASTTWGGNDTWISTSTSFGTSTVLMVAAGGGSSPSACAPGQKAGDAGGLIGTAGATSTFAGNCSGGGTTNYSGAGGGGYYGGGSGGFVSGQSNVPGGFPGTQTAGGISGPSGNNGSANQGGNSENITSLGNHSAGGGGSSYLSPLLTSTSTASSTYSGTGKIIIVETLTYSYIAGGTVTTSTPTQKYGLSQQGMTFYSATSSPTVSSCGTNPSATISGSDASGYVVTGGGSPTSCKITYVTPKDNPPSCTYTAIGAQAYAWIPTSTWTTTSTVINWSTTVPEFSWNCSAY